MKTCFRKLNLLVLGGGGRGGGYFFHLPQKISKVQCPVYTNLCMWQKMTACMDNKDNVGRINKDCFVLCLKELMKPKKMVWSIFVLFNMLTALKGSQFLFLCVVSQTFLKHYPSRRLGVGCMDFRGTVCWIFKLITSHYYT